MESTIVTKLKPELNTLVLLKSNTKPENALQIKTGKYFCIMSLFAQSVIKGKTILFDRNTYGCPGACAGLGFGTAYDKAMGGYETFATFFSKGLESAEEPEKYRAFAEKMPSGVKQKLIEGERFHCSKQKAYKWISKDLPLFDFPEEYRILKPLKELKDGEVAESVIFTVNPIQLTTLITLTGSIREGVNETITPQGAACQMIGNFVFKEGESNNPKAVLGLLDLAARHTVQNILPDDVLTYAVPWKLFLALEKEAEDGIFSSPLWKNLQ
ncbi:hypothetical protein DF185_16270 [Marinifilum breve]|uniref:DUF169 domain-containing protein n=1 Tax=Marinifilum breve TaxID=2184082 RepID=A0A2V3ZYU1_9BACT|nr:DUF169 domain-containing protein [Marinifilum breve]PXX98928.1 hypothetical protein DF185_16270 [Marinifilum breve]